MKSPIFIFLFSLLLIFSITTTTVAHEEHGPEGATNLVYNVTFSNNANNVWWDSILGEASDYHIENGTQAILNVTEITDPQSQYNITIGNVTKYNVPDFSGEEVLAIGYYSVANTFGFIANTTWLDSKSALEAISPDFSNFELTNFAFPIENLLGGELHTTLIQFKDNFQSTKLVYEQNSGILLHMNSTAGGFSLSMSIHSINDNPEYYLEINTSTGLTTTTPTTDELSFSNFYILIGMFSLIYFNHLKKRFH